MGKIVTELIPGFEGYGPREGYDFYGYGSIKDKFSLVYRVVDEDSGKEATFCFFIDKEEAIYLEDVMLREKATRRMASETVYGGCIFMTCIVGSKPIISIPKRGFSFRFYNGEDYDKFLNMLSNFLDNTTLDEKLQKLRDKLKKEREQCLRR